MTYDDLTELLMNHFTSQSFSEEVESAKREFFDRVGIFDEDSADFEMKMSQYVDWYLFTRKLNKSGETPIATALKGGELLLSSEQREYLRSFAESRHSLFEFSKTKGEDVYIKDIFSGEKYIIKDSQVTLGFDKSEYFEARVVKIGEALIFGRSFCFHPAQVSRFIAKEAKLVKKLPEAEQAAAREALILRLFRMKYKHQQYRHVNVKEIYSNDSKLRV